MIRSNPARSAVEVDISVADFVMPDAFRGGGIYVGTAGVLIVEMLDAAPSETVPFVVPAGIVLPIETRKVIKAGTTADDIVALH